MNLSRLRMTLKPATDRGTHPATCKEILRLCYISHLSTRQIATLLKVSRSTAGNTCKRFKESGLQLDEAMALSATDLEEKLFRLTSPQGLLVMGA